jgi:hypothetical protein
MTTSGGNFFVKPCSLMDGYRHQGLEVVGGVVGDGSLWFVYDDDGVIEVRHEGSTLQIIFFD